MATKGTKKKAKRQTRVIVESPDDVEDRLLEDPDVVKQTPEEEDVEDLLSGLPQEARVELWRWGQPERDEWNYVAGHPAHGFSLDGVSREYGGGKYRIIVRGPRIGDDGRTRVVQLARRRFAVAGQVGHAGGGQSELGITLADMLKVNLQAMQTMAMAPRESMADMIRAMHEVGKQQTDPMQTTIQLLTMLKSDKSTLEDMMDVLRTGMELAESKGGDSDSLGVFARAFASLIDRVPKDQPQSRTQPALPAPVVEPAVQASQSFFKTAAVTLKVPSERDADIDLYAHWIVDQLDGLPFLMPYMEEWFKAAEYPMQLLPLFHDCNPAWIRATLLRVKEIMESDEGADAEPAATPPEGDGTNT